MKTLNIKYDKFKKDYEDISIGKGFSGGDENESRVKLFAFLDNASFTLELMGDYDGLTISLMATGRALGVDVQKLYYICSSPIVDKMREAKENKKQLSDAVIAEYTSMILALMYKYSEKRMFELMFKGKH